MANATPCWLELFQINYLQRHDNARKFFKDALILDMAMEQKKKMAEGKMSGNVKMLKMEKEIKANSTHIILVL